MSEDELEEFEEEEEVLEEEKPKKPTKEKKQPKVVLTDEVTEEKKQPQPEWLSYVQILDQRLTTIEAALFRVKGAI